MSDTTDFRPDRLYMPAETWRQIQGKAKAEAKDSRPQGRSKRARKAQDKARKANRSKK